MRSATRSSAGSSATWTWRRCSWNRARTTPQNRPTIRCDAGSACLLSRERALPLERPLQLRDVELLHPQQRLHGPPGLLLVRIAHHLGKHGRHDLPGEAVLVLEPAALLGLRVTARGQLVPVLIHFLLRLAHDLEGDGFVELEDGAAVERGERLPVELEL